MASGRSDELKGRVQIEVRRGEVPFAPTSPRLPSGRGDAAPSTSALEHYVTHEDGLVNRSGVQSVRPSLWCGRMGLAFCVAAQVLPLVSHVR
jgi:hypothetical protein